MTRQRTGATLVHDWNELYKNPGIEFEFEGDRNSLRSACAQYFKRHGKNVKVFSRTENGINYLMVMKPKYQRKGKLYV